MTDKTYCNGCGKFHPEVEAMIAMTNSLFVCNECVDLLHNIAQKENARTPCEPENAKSSWKNSTEFTPTFRPCAPT